MLIGDRLDGESLLEYCRELLRRVINRVLLVHPLLLRKIDEFIVTAINLVACILTELLNNKDKKLDAFWVGGNDNHLMAIYDMLSSNAGVLPQADIENSIRHHSAAWNLLRHIRNRRRSARHHILIRALP